MNLRDESIQVMIKNPDGTGKVALIRPGLEYDEFLRQIDYALNVVRTSYVQKFCRKGVKRAHKI